MPSAINTFDTSNAFATLGFITVQCNRDATAKQPYLAFTTPITEPHCGGAQTSYIPYEDEQSIADKGAFARAQGYGGIIVWTLAEGYLAAAAAGGRPRNALTQALKHAFLD